MSHLTRVVNFFRQPSLEREFDDELRFHLQERTARNIAAGMTPEAAEADARRRFGSIDRAREGMRAARLAGRLSIAVVTATLACAAAASLYCLTRERVYDVKADVSAPVPIATARAVYTPAAMHEKIQGTVRLQCVVERDGACSDVTVVQSLDKTFGLDDEAVRTLRQWRFRPGMRRGAPVATRVKFDLRFTLR